VATRGFPEVVQQFRGDLTRPAATRDKDNDQATALRSGPAAVDPVYLAVFINGLAGHLQVTLRLHG